MHDETIAILRRLAGLGMGYCEIGAGAHVSPTTVRIALISGELPQRPRPKRALVTFCRVNASATKRSELRFTDVP